MDKICVSFYLWLTTSHTFRGIDKSIMDSTARPTATDSSWLPCYFKLRRSSNILSTSTQSWTYIQHTTKLQNGNFRHRLLEPVNLETPSRLAAFSHTQNSRLRVRVLVLCMRKYICISPWREVVFGLRAGSFTGSLLAYQVVYLIELFWVEATGYFSLLGTIRSLRNTGGKTKHPIYIQSISSSDRRLVSFSYLLIRYTFGE